VLFFGLCLQISHNKSLQHHFAALRWTVFKSQFCEFATQILSQNYNLKTAAELGVRAIMKEIVDQEFNRTFISKVDMERCISFAIAAASQTEAVIQRGLVTAAIISYARPFSENRSHDKAVSKIKFRNIGFTEEELKLHKKICNLRNKAIAHSDYEMNLAEAKEYRPTGYSVMSRIYDPLNELQIVGEIQNLAEKVKSALEIFLFHLANSAAVD
jgi:hypothetical protein